MDHFKPLGDLAMVGTIIAIIVGWLPHIAALLGVVWWAIRIYETQSVKKLLGKENEPDSHV